MTLKELIKEVENITNEYIGKIDSNAYRNINKDVEKFLETAGLPDEVRVNYYDGIIIDTSKSVGIGGKQILLYKIEWKSDKRKSYGLSDKILNITVKSDLPDDYLECSIGELVVKTYITLAEKYKDKLEKRILELKIEMKSLERGIDKMDKIIAEKGE